MNDIIKIVQALKNSNTFINGVTKTIKNETKEQKGGFLSMLLGTIEASLLGNLLTRKGILRAGSGQNISNFELQNIIKMNQDLMVFFQEIIYLKKIKDGAYVINLDEYANVGTNWIALFCKKMKLFISVVSVLNIFLTKLKNLLKNFLEIKI